LEAYRPETRYLACKAINATNIGDIIRNEWTTDSAATMNIPDYTEKILSAAYCQEIIPDKMAFKEKYFFEHYKQQFKNYAVKKIEDIYGATGGGTTYGTCNDTFNIGWKEIYGICENGFEPQKVDPLQLLKEIIRSRRTPLVIVRRKPLQRAVDIREECARTTLRRVIGDEQFRKLLSKGFITVRAPSGKVYQIFPAHGITNVYENGKQIESLCVVLKAGFPPTDSIIMRYLMILNNEEEFRSKAVKHGVSIYNRSKMREVDDRSLVEIYNDLKKAA